MAADPGDHSTHCPRGPDRTAAGHAVCGSWGRPFSAGAASLDLCSRNWPSRSDKREKFRGHGTRQIAITIAGGDELVLVDSVDRPDINRGASVVHPDEPIDVVLLAEETAFNLSGPAARDSPGRAHSGPVQTVHPDRLSVQN